MKNGKCYLMGMRFENVDVIKVMEKIVERHTLHYKSDFELDRETIARAAGKEHLSDRTYLWLCRINGTWLFRECDVLLQGTSEHDAYCYYAGGNPNDVLSFAIEVKGTEDGVVKGDIIPLDYGLHSYFVMESAKPAACILMRFENGVRTRPLGRGLVPVGPDEEYGNFQSFSYVPKSKYDYHALLHAQRMIRHRTDPGDAAAYVARV